MNIDLNKGQIYACMDMSNWYKTLSKQVFELNGAAGTGKTTVIQYFIRKMGLDMSNVLFVAYMGKAVSQMIRNNLPARTMHSACYDCEMVPYRDEEGHLVRTKSGRPKMVLNFVLKEKIPGKIKLIVIDEGFMVPEKNAKDLMSFGIPVVVLGDTNQLPPVFGKPYFLNHPDYTLTEIMRQQEGDPIIILSQKVLNGEPLTPCVLGRSCVIERKYLSIEQLVDSDVILTCTNRLRGELNTLFRENIMGIQHLEYPNYGEKVICRKNNWDQSIRDKMGEIYLTNGLSGTVTGLEKSSYTKDKVRIDFKPDFSSKEFRNLNISIPFLNTPTGQNKEIFVPTGTDSFEYAYAISVHLSQGSQYDRVTFLREKNFFGNEMDYRRIQYTAITRAREAVRIVI